MQLLRAVEVRAIAVMAALLLLLLRGAVISIMCGVWPRGPGVALSRTAQLRRPASLLGRESTLQHARRARRAAMKGRAAAAAALVAQASQPSGVGTCFATPTPPTSAPCVPLRRGVACSGSALRMLA